MLLLFLDFFSIFFFSKRRRRLGDRQTTSCTQGLSRLLFEMKTVYIYF